MSFRYDPYDPEVMRDPLPFYRRLREEHPYYYIPEYDTYVVTRFYGERAPSTKGAPEKERALNPPNARR